MKKIDISQLITILANIGVIAGIVFLGFELRQNNTELASQSRMNFYEMRSALETDFIRNIGGISDLVGKSFSGADLTTIENARLGARNLHLLNTFQFMYQENPEGTMEAGAWIAGLFRLTPGLNDAWIETKGNFEPEFVGFLDDQLTEIGL